MSSSKIERFTSEERVAHWLSALSFLYAALTGLSLWTPQLFWLSSLFGGGGAVRRWHPWGGVVFALMLALMFRRWAKQMRLDKDDKRWLARAHRYAVHDEKGLPESGRFNAGQKMLFWVQSLATLLLLASGVVLWLPQLTSPSLRLAAILVHPAVAIVSILGIIVHIYMGTAAVPGAFRGMTQGFVDAGWARAHHAKWYRDVSKN